MEAVREAIKRALEKGTAQDRAFREKVYRQAFSALDRSLQARTDLSGEEKHRQREQVKTIIVEIEREFRRPPAPQAAARPSVPVHQEPAPTAPAADFVPRVEREDRFDASARSGRDIPVGRGADEFGQRGSKRRSFGVILALAVLIAAGGIGAWWISQTGLWQSIAGSTSAPPPAVEETLEPGRQTPAGLPGRAGIANGDWITVFSPDNPTTVTAPSGTSAEVVEATEGKFLRIGGETEAAVSFDVGQGVLENLAGKQAVFSLTARAAEGSEGQISISCDFGALGGCGRKRYVVGSQPADYLFEIELPDQQPSAGGRIIIVPDMEGRGRMLDVFSLRAAAQN